MSALEKLGIRWIRFQSDVLRLLTYPGGIVRRAVLGYTSAKVSVKVVLSRWLTFTSERFFGSTVRCIRYREFAFTFREIFIRRTYDFSAATTSPVILDVGANIGMASLYFKWRYPNARIIAFEPASAVFAILEENVQGNGLSDVRTVRAAVGRSSGTTVLRTPQRADGIGMRLRSTSTRSGEAAVAQEGVSVHEESVPMVTLSQYVSDHGPVFVKLDVEGAEGDIVRELDEAGVLPTIPEMVVEYHPTKCDVPLGELLTMLERSGFSVIISGTDSVSCIPDVSATDGAKAFTIRAIRNG
jgi:FkbM family methyltransferase